MNIDQLKIKATAKHKETSAFLTKLKQRPPKKLDQIMEQLHDEVFEKTDCLKCGNCCRTTGPLLLPKDIETLATHLRMKPGKFIDQYLRVDEDNDTIFKGMPCPFLGEDNYCSVYDHRPKACREFPHTNRKKFYQINHLTIQNVALCPAAFDVVERLKKII
ncbi:MAG: YkgJ family cysteine cluster protein [Bacteroidia bacterium]